MWVVVVAVMAAVVVVVLVERQTQAEMVECEETMTEKLPLLELCC